MAVILSLLGIVLAAAGVAAVGFGIPINEFTLGTTLVLAGTTALAGGLILIGLSAPLFSQRSISALLAVSGGRGVVSVGSSGSRSGQLAMANW